MGLFDQSFSKSAKIPNVTATVPRSYKRTQDWIPRIGDIFPNFTAETTTGQLHFHQWAEGRWVHLFNCPKIGGSVTTTELGSFSSAAPEFDQRNIASLGVAQTTRTQQLGFEAEVQRLFGVGVNFPILLDQQGHLGQVLGMYHWRDSFAHAVRKSFLIDPSLKVRGLFEYPLNIGRSLNEILRTADAHILHDREGLVTPSDWQPGEDALVPSYMDHAEVDVRFGERMICYSPDLHMVPTRGIDPVCSAAL